MLDVTLSRLRCPIADDDGLCCAGELRLLSSQVQGSFPSPSGATVNEISSGTLECENCGAEYPILAGVALLVSDVRSYLLMHVKGISKAVPDSAIPEEFREEYLQAKLEIESEHIEEDLESERVVALYLMTHYLRVPNDAGAKSSGSWWKPEAEAADPGSELIDDLVKKYWNRGPFSKIGEWFREASTRKNLISPLEVIELGCGVGGLYRELEEICGFYLGVDTSFASILLARHLVLGTPYYKALEVPADLLNGPLARAVSLPIPTAFNGRADFILGAMEELPVKGECWDFSVALNAIDMLDDPQGLPHLQASLLKEGGTAIQSGPYVWHSAVSEGLRKLIPDSIKNSALAVEWMYESAGLKLTRSEKHVPWLFFKHLRQLEVYSVHLLSAEK
jgi:SAM-dependent methyltransferase